MVIFLKDIEEGFVFSVSEMKSQVRKVLLKGGAAVDVECVEKVGVAHVYIEGSDVYDALLNQVNNFFLNISLGCFRHGNLILLYQKYCNLLGHANHVTF